MKRHYILLTLIVTFFFSCSTPRKIRELGYTKATDIYYLKYYYEEAPDKIIFYSGASRVLQNDNSFCIFNYAISDSVNSNYKTCFDKRGNPTGTGTDADFTKFYKDSVKVNFKNIGKVFQIKTEDFNNPVSFWFWKTHPTLNDSVVVTAIRKNFVTNKIDLIQTVYKYLINDTILSNGNSVKCFLVQSKQAGEYNNIYDETWYDETGMIIKVRHVVAKDGVRVAELFKKVKSIQK